MGSPSDRQSRGRVPAATHFCTAVGGATRLKITTAGIASSAAETVFESLQRAADRTPQRIALNVKRGGAWKSWTFRRLVGEVKLVAKALIQVHFVPARQLRAQTGTGAWRR